MESLANPRKERRKTPRHQLKEILYINLEPDNGGIVVDLSEEGLSFRCAIPIPQTLRPDEPVQFSFLLPHGQQIKVSAIVAWTGQTRKTGGLRFTNLSVATRAQILNLIGESSAGASTSHDSTAASPIQPSSTQPLTADMPHLSPLPSQIPPQAQKTVEAQKAVETQKLPEVQKLTEVPKIADTQRAVDTPPSPAPPFPISESYYPRVRDSWLPPPEEPRSFRGATIAFIVVALLAGAGWLAYSHRIEVGAQMVKWGEQLQGGSQAASESPQQSSQPSASQSTGQSGGPTQIADATSQPAPTTPEPLASSAAAPSPEAPVPSETPASAKTPALSKTPALARTMKSPAPPKQPSRATHPALEARASDSPDKRSASDVEDGAADVAAAQRYLEGKEQTRNSAAAAQLLWAAVAKGDLTAETTLARLYLNGDGVTRSCEQARVLLKAASDHGDSQAEETLAQVSRNRCR